MNWYRVTLTDNWCKPTRWHGYVRAPARHLVEEIAIEHCPDRAMCEVSSVSAFHEYDDDEVQARLGDVTSPNAAILEDGTIWRRSEVFAPA